MRGSIPGEEAMKTPAELRLKSGHTPPYERLKSRCSGILGPFRLAIAGERWRGFKLRSEEVPGVPEESGTLGGIAALVSCCLKVNCWRGRVLHGDDGISRILDGPILRRPKRNSSRLNLLRLSRLSCLNY